MTVLEFSNEFDITYNSIASKTATGIDLYEKSVYLTTAQLEIIKNYFEPKGNKYVTGFEGNSKRRNDLKELIRSHIATTPLTSTKGISDLSKFFTIPNDTFIIVQESAKISSTNGCLNGTYLDVTPKTHDEYNIQKKNPFRKPNKNNIWRLDYSIQSGNKNVELISEYPITEYKMRYIKYPSPIVLTNLNTEYPGEGLSIDGISTSQTCQLSESIHREILVRAVKLAIADYEPQNFQIKEVTSQQSE